MDSSIPWVTFTGTKLGPCGLLWADDRILRVVLPDFVPLPSLVREGPASPLIASVLERLARHILGAPDSFLDVPLALATCSPFRQRVYEETRTVAPGETLTYGDIARRMGAPGSARAVGTALRLNPWPIVIPSHRVVALHDRDGTKTSLCCQLRRLHVP